MCSMCTRIFFLILSLFCFSRLLFCPNSILTALCGNRLHNLQNKWKHSIFKPRNNYPCLKSLALMLWTAGKTSLLFFLKWFSPTCLYSWIICSPFEVFLYLILLKRRRTESLNPRLVWSLCNSELFLSFSKQPGTQKEQNGSVCMTLHTEREGWATSLHPVSGFCFLSRLGKENACSLWKSQIKLALWLCWPLPCFDHKICEVRITNLAKQKSLISPPLFLLSLQLHTNKISARTGMKYTLTIWNGNAHRLWVHLLEQEHQCEVQMSTLSS